MLSRPFFGLPIATGPALATLACAPAAGFLFTLILAVMP
jgi:hypothetical protein